MRGDLTFRVAPYSLPLVSREGVRNRLYPHQAEIWDRWEVDTTTLLAAKTGTGKTRAAMLPVLCRREFGIAVYPTNELLRDQVRSVEKLALDEGIKTVSWLPSTSPDRYAAADVILVPIDGPLLDAWQKTTHGKSRLEVLQRLLEPDKSKIVFTNPDILFRILALRYHANPFAHLKQYETLVIDEFHLYQGVELAHALAMIGMARAFGFFRRVLLLSATPHPDVRSMLDRLYGPRVIEPGVPASGLSTEKSRVAVHNVEVTAVQLAAPDPVDTLIARLSAMRLELQRLRAENRDSEYIPAVVIVNSVVNAIRLEDKLVESGFDRESLAIIRGLSNREIRSTRGKLLALGTSAIEVGVDFHCDYLFFEAIEAASFMQRFGRVGRHGPGKAVALVPPNAYSGMSRLPAEIDRTAFEERINAWYPSSSVRPWFVTTEYGMVTARALMESFMSITREGGIREEMECRLRNMIEGALSGLSERLGCSLQNLQAKATFELSRTGKIGSTWVKAYCDLNQFRTSLPSVVVRDFTEYQRRADWPMGEYEADLRTLLKRAVGISWNASLGILTIKGIGKLRKVRASDIFDRGGEDCGIFETKDYPNLLLYQDDQATPISDLMGEKNHIFGLVRKRDVEADVDWRLPVFETGEYLIAFDGAALLLLEMARRAKAS